MNRVVHTSIWLLCTFAAHAAGPSWIHASSPHFEIFSTAGPGDTRRVLQQFERVRGFFGLTLDSAIAPPSDPVRVILFGTKTEFEAYRSAEFAGAYYTHISGRDYIVLGGLSSDVFPIAAHEYVHLAAQRAGLKLPPWLSEGMAELYSTLRQMGHQLVLGSLIPARMNEIARQKWVPLSTILAATKDSPYYNERDKTGSLYDEGWALTHMLELSPAYSSRFSEVVLQIGNGAPSQAAIESAYGKPLDSIGRDLRTYLRGDTFAARIFPIKLPEAAPAADLAPADPSAVNLTLLDLNSHSGRQSTRLEMRLALARAQLARHRPKETLNTLSAITSVTHEAAPRFFELLAAAQRENGDRAAARVNALRWIENARDPADRERGVRFVKSLDARN